MLMVIIYAPNGDLHASIFSAPVQPALRLAAEVTRFIPKAEQL